MKTVLFVIIVSVLTVSALEFTPSQVVLPPVDGMVWNGSAWVTK